MQTSFSAVETQFRFMFRLLSLSCATQLALEPVQVQAASRGAQSIPVGFPKLHFFLSKSCL